ncbi:dTDP-4-dehydrorhamnose reductase [Gordonibacter massiliensis (ex Traore et al. 2017)]|uniref:dTDP-4-dehydrorhamnose reductase n=1 Tax=Gordonibacter massiliensis (ex Traore et al. 2017) TaxID=1841863 RepID=UPI001C8C2FED|nr:dTDP-4-dehydrorhamnose reductase [Gordonibacter massiliensis (ex Traore et al. 2017)]MBX9033648.1 dTDP-4-dehydrorhamnose reductase [Gordonibacter massiliensis (ex Traore et al. 2017)]
MKILITGGKGQLGNELRRCLKTMKAEIGSIPEEYVGAQVDCIDYDALDISDPHAVHAWFAECGPYDLVINGAAVTNVDGCERDEASALHVNAFGPENLARECERCGAKLVQVSTDYVFAGDDPNLRVEDDPVRPISAYGRTKWAGEVLAVAACSRTFVVRTAWLYGYVGKNFVKTMLRLAHENGNISVVSDQMGNPTNANDLAYEILKLAATETYGTYHCTNEGTCSWFDFASAAVDLAGLACEKEPLTSAEYKARFPQSADRPAYSSLRNLHLEETIGNEMRPWREALEMYMTNLQELGD